MLPHGMPSCTHYYFHMNITPKDLLIYDNNINISIHLYAYHRPGIFCSGKARMTKHTCVYSTATLKF